MFNKVSISKSNFWREGGMFTESHQLMIFIKIIINLQIAKLLLGQRALSLMPHGHFAGGFDWLG